MSRAWQALAFGIAVASAISIAGHFYEGRKPAFVDDIVGLVIGPLFVVVEAGFLLGLRRGLQHEIEARVGPVREGPPAHAA